MRKNNIKKELAPNDKKEKVTKKNWHQMTKLKNLQKRTGPKLKFKKKNRFQIKKRKDSNLNIDYDILPGEKLEKIEYEINPDKEKVIISIITPYYNAEKYIEQTAKSVLNQTFPFFEWIIVDDGSENKGIEKLKQVEKMDKRIKVFYNNQTNSGPAVARDFGIDKSSKDAKYIVFLDSDDLYSNTFLECCYWTLETHPKASWTYTDAVNFGTRNFLWRKWFDVEWEKEENLLTVLACIRKKDLLEVGKFGIKEKRVYEDWYLWLKLLKCGKYPVRMSSLLTWYRQKEEFSELKQSKTQNRKNADKLIKQIKRDIVNYDDAIQYPKFDYDWEKIDELNTDIKKCKLKQNQKIKILMIIPWMTIGGADRFNLDLISKMDRNKFEFIIVTTSPCKNELKNQFEKNAYIYDLTSFLDMKDWICFINYLIEKYNINIIFNSNSQFGYKIIPYLKAKYSQIPIIDFVHMEEWYWRNGGFSRDSSLVSNYIDKTFTCNENSKKIFINYFKRKSEEIETIYIGVDEKRFNPDKFNKQKILKEIKEKYKIENIENKKIISYICRITGQKRPYLFLEIIKKLKHERNDFIALIVGDGDLLEKVKEKAKKYSLLDKIYFIENQDEPEKIYKISDLTINTSIKEGLALTSYESLAMGVPVVSSDVGGQKELITKDVGEIVPCMQKEEDILDLNYSKIEVQTYVMKINKILDNLEKYRINCRKKILENFTIDKMIKKMEDEFTNIAKKPNKEKIKNGELLKDNKQVLLELISTFFLSNKQEYEYLVDKFNRENIHISSKHKKAMFYEHTLEYKIKHPIVIVLRKIGIYDALKKTVSN